MSTSESISNKAGELTNNTVGQKSIVTEATDLAQHSLEFGKPSKAP